MARRIFSYTRHRQIVLATVPADAWFTQRAAGGFPHVLRRLVEDGFLEVRTADKNDLCRLRQHREYRMTDAGRDYRRSRG
jgi:hypothetical protein